MYRFIGADALQVDVDGAAGNGVDLHLARTSAVSNFLPSNLSASTRRRAAAVMKQIVERAPASTAMRSGRSRARTDTRDLAVCAQPVRAGRAGASRRSM